MEPNIWEKEQETSFNNFFPSSHAKSKEFTTEILLDRLLKMETRQRELESALSQKVTNT
jgi:hypothetical protein